MSFTEKDLQNGDVVVMDGTWGIVNKEMGAVITKTDIFSTCVLLFDKEHSEHLRSVIKVYRPKELCQCSYDPEFYTRGECIFDNEVKPSKFNKEQLLAAISSCITGCCDICPLNNVDDCHKITRRTAESLFNKICSEIGIKVMEVTL